MSARRKAECFAMADLLIHLDRLFHNAMALKALTDKAGIDLVGVTKCFCGDPKIAELYLRAGIKTLADSRLRNLAKMNSLPGKRMLLRLPALSEAAETVAAADVSIISHVRTAQRLSDCASDQNRGHDVILMVDLGDLREGIFFEENVYSAAAEILDLPGIKLRGVAANFCCLYGVRPSIENMAVLERIKNTIEKMSGTTLDVISGGNSSSLHMLMEGTLPAFVNQLRIGDALLCGQETAFGSPILGMHSNCFQLRAEIIELNRKPTVPVGEIGVNGYGEAPAFEDRGVRTRMICDVGRQDLEFDQLVFEDLALSVIGGSSDHLVLDIEDSDETYQLGDTVTFGLTYAGITRAMSSAYFARHYLGGRSQSS